MEERLTCVLVDDDRMSLRILESLVEKTSFLEPIGVFEDPLQAFKLLSEQDVDILFLDVEMTEMTGLELLDSLDRKSQIILTTSKHQYAVEAFDYEVADFLLKPIDNYARFLKAVRKAKAAIQKPKESPQAVTDQIFLKVESLLVNVSLKQIQYIEAFGDYIKVHTPIKTYVVHAKLRTMEEILPAQDFARVHRSYIVRVDQILNIDINNLQIRDKVIPISNSYRVNLMSKIKTIT